jgi:hypothetical protein
VMMLPAATHQPPSMTYPRLIRTVKTPTP